MSKGHFKREAKLMFIFPFLVVFVGIAVGLLYVMASDYIGEDKCLDIGGKYNDGRCVTEDSKIALSLNNQMIYPVHSG
ncbi:MAG: hypothetical protein KUG73_13210 [Pseudomonadales bacterium]|nr:hypothetical protein [Pseudomonadales bacterium]